jgi:hypothetical protein
MSIMGGRKPPEVTENQTGIGPRPRDMMAGDGSAGKPLRSWETKAAHLAGQSLRKS